MPTMIKDILRVSAEAPRRTKAEVLCKLTEELGEVATMINKPTKEFDEPLAGEIADCLNALVDLLYIDLAEKNPDADPYILMQSTEILLEKWSHRKVRKWRDNYVKFKAIEDGL
jgi:hypothetical protein